MIPSKDHLSWFSAAALLIAGALQTLTFAPFEQTSLALPAVFLCLLAVVPLRSGSLFRAGWLLGLGLFGTGASWVYISISDYGNTAAWIAVVLTLLFVAGLALFPALTLWAWGRVAGNSVVRRLILFPAFWVLGDWVRSWLLTGFPWLYLGTAQVDGPLAGLAPITGVHGITLLLTACGAALYGILVLFQQKRPRAAASVAVLAALPWLTVPLLEKVDWTERAEEPLTVTAVQGNIPQLMKWDPDFLKQQVRSYLRLTESHWDADLILWPETAIPILYDRAEPILTHIESRLGEKSTLVTGIPWYGYAPSVDGGTYRNSILAVGNGQGRYAKQKLVPFGEYVPLQNVLRGLIGFFDLPMSEFSPGPGNQPPLSVGPHEAMPFICYEVAYPEFVARNARDTEWLLTISNDGWFGQSIGPLQHLQIARMRALETGRFMIRGTNNGVTAIIDENGRIQTRIPQFEQAVLTGEFYPVKGTTPFMAAQSWPVLTLAMILIVFARPRIIPKPSKAMHTGQ